MSPLVIMLFLALAPLAVLAAVAEVRSEDNEVFGRSSSPSTGSWKVVSKMMSECGSEDLTEVMNCLGVKAVAVLDRAARMGNIDVLQGVTLTKNPDLPEDNRFGRALLSEAEITQSLPQEPAQRSARLLDLLYDGAVRFLQSHTLQVKVPEGAPETFARALDEGRAKLKKKIFPILMLVGLKLFAVIPIILGVIGLVAAKALIVGKLALIIAGIIAVQKFMSSGGSSSFSGFGKFPQVSSEYGAPAQSSGWSSSGGSTGGYSYRRSLDDEAQKMAYSAYAPEATNTA